MARRRLLPGLVALATFTALTIAVLAPCLCGAAAGSAGKSPSCHAAMARHAGSVAGTASSPARIGAPECCCAKNPAPNAVAPATYGAPAEPDRSLLVAVAAPSTPWTGSAAERTESLGVPLRLGLAPPPTLLPLRI